MMSEQPGQTRPLPPDHDPIIHLDFPVTDYPQRCACGHAMCSFIDFISELEPLTPRSRP